MSKTYTAGHLWLVVLIVLCLIGPDGSAAAWFFSGLVATVKVTVDG